MLNMCLLAVAMSHPEILVETIPLHLRTSTLWWSKWRKPCREVIYFQSGLCIFKFSKNAFLLTSKVLRIPIEHVHSIWSLESGLSFGFVFSVKILYIFEVIVKTNFSINADPYFQRQITYSWSREKLLAVGSRAESQVHDITNQSKNLVVVAAGRLETARPKKRWLAFLKLKKPRFLNNNHQEGHQRRKRREDRANQFRSQVQIQIIIKNISH